MKLPGSPSVGVPGSGQGLRVRYGPAEGARALRAGATTALAPSGLPGLGVDEGTDVASRLGGTSSELGSQASGCVRSAQKDPAGDPGRGKRNPPTHT